MSSRNGEEKAFSSGCYNILEWSWGRYLSFYCCCKYVAVAGTGRGKDLPALHQLRVGLPAADANSGWLKSVCVEVLEVEGMCF